jgi:predicted PurR-regulated permease PerM
LNNRNPLLPVVALVGVIGILYFAKPVLVPLSLAVLLSFVLSPLVDRLQRRLPFTRTAAVAVVTVCVFLLLAILTAILFTQLLNVAKELPRYQNNLRTKITELKSPVGRGLDRTWQTLEELSRELTVTEPESPAVPEVEVREPTPSAIEVIRSMLVPILKPMGTALIVIVFTVFMLLKREELRDKVIKLIGPERLTVTTGAINEATIRVSRYLMMQTMINGGQGLVVGVLLYLIGVPNAGMFGILSAVLRFIPYVGPWLGAAMPIALAFIVFDNWMQPALTIAMFVCVELISNNIFEPWLLGSYTGVSSMALIVAAVFWTWLWGGAGLLLSTPLTVCLVVLGKYIPQLNFLYILLGDEPVLSPSERLYQRLLGSDQEEVDVLLQEEFKEHTLEEVSETLLFPVLQLIEQDLFMNALDEARYDVVIEKMKEVITGISSFSEKEETSSRNVQGGLVLCFASRDAADEAASMILAALLRNKGIDAQWVSVESLAGELVHLVENQRPAAICISALPPNAVNHAKYLCKRLRSRFSKLPLLVGLWESTVELQKTTEILTEAGADLVVRAPAEGVAQLQQWIAQNMVVAGGGNV